MYVVEELLRFVVLDFEAVDAFMRLVHTFIRVENCGTARFSLHPQRFSAWSVYACTEWCVGDASNLFSFDGTALSDSRCLGAHHLWHVRVQNFRRSPSGRAGQLFLTVRHAWGA